MPKDTTPAVVMFAGPSGTGKSTLIEQVAQGSVSPDLAALIPAGIDKWNLVAAAELRADEASDALRRLARNGGLIIHYDYIKARVTGVTDFLEDPAVQLFLAGKELTLIDIVPTPERLVSQFNRRNAARLAHQRERRGAARYFFSQRVRLPIVRFLWRLGVAELRDVASLYEHPGFVRDAIDRWSSFVRDMVARHPSIRRIEVEPAGRKEKPRFRLRQATA